MTTMLDQRYGVISIHALREESDSGMAARVPVDRQISIHALREESDRNLCTGHGSGRNFYPRSP